MRRRKVEVGKGKKGDCGRVDGYLIRRYRYKEVEWWAAREVDLL